MILEIFRRHARSRAAKAQVEIVRLQYMVPRLRESGKGRDRQRGGIGGKGAGESSLELDRRKIRDRIAELTRELDALAEEQRTQRARRRDMNRVALVGYTNAGKSTLMRALTGSEVYVADKLFATLDTTVRPLRPGDAPAHPGLRHGRLHRQAAARAGGVVQEHARRGAGGVPAGARGRRVRPGLRAPAGGHDRGAGRDRRRRRAAPAGLQQDRSRRRRGGRGGRRRRVARALARGAS